MIYRFEDSTPSLPEEYFVADSAAVIGDVTLHNQSSIWFGMVLRGDIEPIIVGECSNIQDNSVAHTSHGKRDGHLKNVDFFNVEKFPEMTFKSTSVKKTGDGTFEVAGKLNVLGIDREVVLPVTINGPVEGRGGATLIGVECNTTLNRRDLGITHSPSAVIADEVKIRIEAEATFK